MKKILRAIILLTICCSVISGCGSDTGLVSEPVSESGSETGFDYKPISEIYENFSEDCERVKNKSYDNLIFKNTKFSFPQISEVSELTLTPLIGKSADEIYEFFSEAVDTLTDNKYTDEEKKHEIRFVDAYSTSDGNDPENKEPYPYDCPGIDEYKNGLETDYPWPTIDNGEYFIDMMFGVLRGFDNGALIEYDKADRKSRAMYFMIDGNSKHKPVFFTEDLTCTDTYNLVNGEISIADAAKFAQNYLDNLKFTPYEGIIPKPKIVGVFVVDIGGECYGYDFVTTVEYKGVNFDHRDSEGGPLIETDYDNCSYDTISGKIDMIETDKIHHFMSIASGNEITEGDPQTSIITLESAADKVNEFLSGIMKFSVQDVSMVYLPTKTRNQITEERAFPCWKFKLISSGEIYHTFINMLSGEIYLYVQAA